ncbi:cyclodeaminase/cyclohydrolase family protein [Pseudonocardia alni]|uniref:cyclodeaminase/cyclohydrolase family protein n=1 Tax=Pseudonocardia alni TaxID=33907 RepID=UPI0033D69A7E
MEQFLATLAERIPAPGGGATAAVHAAQAAALLGMVGRYSTGPRYAEHADVVEKVLVATDAARTAALGLADEDARAFTPVGAAYALPASTEAERAHRSDAIASGLVLAAGPPSAVIGLAGELMSWAGVLLPVANRSVITDVAAASEAARAAATTARLNVEVNLRGITDTTHRAHLVEVVATVDDLCVEAERIDRQVRLEIAT